MRKMVENPEFTATVLKWYGRLVPAVDLSGIGNTLETVRGPTEKVAWEVYHFRAEVRRAIRDRLIDLA